VKEVELTEDLQGRAALVYHTRDDGAVLAVWNRRYEVWGLPGGKVEAGETVRRAAVREFTEECGAAPCVYTFHGESGVPYLRVGVTAPFYAVPTYTGSGRQCYVCGTHGVFAPLVSNGIGGGIGWMSREFLCSQETLGVGAWFKTFFEFLDKEHNFQHAIGAGNP
jgi:hypothetical protein